MRQWSHEDAQAIVVMVEGVIFVSMYVSCSGYAPMLQGEIVDFLAREFRHVPWFLCGDHNEIPTANLFSQNLEHEGASLLVVRDDAGDFLPPRHDGDRCIDYGITNRPSFIELLDFWPSEISDHKVFSKTTWQRTQTDQCGCPNDVPEAMWHTVVSQLWDQSCVPLPPSVLSQNQVDDMWDDFCCTLQTVLGQARQQLCPLERPQRSANRTHKNRVLLHRTDVPLGPARSPGSTFYECRLWNLAHKLGEVSRLEVKGQIFSRAYFCLCARKL